MDGFKAAVVVGVDGSPQARAAVSWAVAEARDRDIPMRLVAVVDDQTRIHSQEQAQDALRLAFCRHRKSTGVGAFRRSRQVWKRTLCVAGGVPVGGDHLRG